jgi:hypothetical protein
MKGLFRGSGREPLRGISDGERETADFNFTHHVVLKMHHCLMLIVETIILQSCLFSSISQVLDFKSPLGFPTNDFILDFTC